MPTINPAQLAAWTDGQWTTLPGSALTGFSNDTRTLRPGEIFIALHTPARDGHDYLAAAAAAGAAAAIVSRADTTLPLPQLIVADPLTAFQKIAAAHRAAFQSAGGIVIAISGSAGKTSTKNLLAEILRAAHGPDQVLATAGNLNNHIGVPITLTRLDPAHHRYAVIEAGISAPGEMELLATMIAPDHAIITLIAPAHTQDLGGLEGVAREKAILLHHVRPGGLRIFPGSAEPQLGMAAHRAAPSTLAPFNLPTLFPSAGMAQNAALAITLAIQLGVSNSQIHSALAAWRPSKWRGEFIRDPDPANANRLYYLDLYNANPASMADALDTFARIAPADLPRLYVLGGMEELGPESPRYHRELGAQLAALLRDRPDDEAILIGPHAPDIAAGISLTRSRIQILDTAAHAAPLVAAHRGAIFLKGSRRYALENALPASFQSGAWASRPASATSHTQRAPESSGS